MAEFGVERSTEGLLPNPPQAMGTATMAAGTVTVLCSRITGRSLVFVLPRAVGAGVVVEVAASRIAGTSFVVSSTDVADTRVVQWIIFEPIT